mmetsp:Transcript_18690/g.33658  ORF Transcript_18690/g.33658 Transcript_18690/m.33658 type:complete len:246 (+) Transcript_18690:134-871(+)
MDDLPLHPPLQNQQNPHHHRAAIRTHHLLPLPPRRMARAKLRRRQSHRPLLPPRTVLRPPTPTADSKSICPRTTRLRLRRSILHRRNGIGPPKKARNILPSTSIVRNVGCSVLQPLRDNFHLPHETPSSHSRTSRKAGESGRRTGIHRRSVDRQRGHVPRHEGEGAQEFLHAVRVPHGILDEAFGHWERVRRGFERGGVEECVGVHYGIQVEGVAGEGDGEGGGVFDGTEVGVRGCREGESVGVR